MQARLVQKLPDGERWMYEAKFDGYRAIAIKDDDHVEDSIPRQQGSDHRLPHGMRCGG